MADVPRKDATDPWDSISLFQIPCNTCKPPLTLLAYVLDPNAFPSTSPDVAFAIARWLLVGDEGMEKRRPLYDGRRWEMI